MKKMFIFQVVLGVFFVGTTVYAQDEQISLKTTSLSEIYDKSLNKNNPIVAEIDDKKIYLSDIKTISDNIPQLSELPFDMVYPRLLEQYIATEVVLKSAHLAQIEDDEHVQQAIKDARNTILSKAYLENRIDELATPEKLKELYLEEIKNVERQDEIHARHILVRTEQEAKEILGLLKSGADFKTLANAKSLDAESANGGDLGYFQEKMMIPEFSGPVFALKKGELSQPIKTPFGWHIVLVEDKRLADLPAFEEVQDQLRQLFLERNIKSILKQEEQKYKVNIIVPNISQSDLSDMAVLQKKQKKKNLSNYMQGILDNILLPNKIHY